MTGSEYQNTILNYGVGYPENLGAFCSVLKMNEQLGALSAHLVKILSKPRAEITPKERDVFAVQLGEMLAYLTRTIYHCGLNLDDIMQLNIDLTNRYNEIHNMSNKDIFRK